MSAPYLGDIAEDSTIDFIWSTNDAVGASITRATDGTISVYKANGTTQSVAGITDTEDFDSLTGVHHCRIDTSADAFYAVGNDYAVVLSAATIDGQTVNAPIAHFSIENRFDEVDVNGLILQRTTIATLASQTSFTLAAGSADDDAYNSMVIVIEDATTGAQKAIGEISDYAGSTKTVTLARDPGVFTMATTDIVTIIAGATANTVWSEILTGATHNINNSAGKRLREAVGLVYTDGTAQAGGVNTITLASGESSTDDLYEQSYVAIIGGTGAGQGHHILSYNGTTKVAVIDDDWVVQPDATSEYIIIGSGSHDENGEGLAQAGAASTITLDSNASAIDDTYNDSWVVIVSGTGVGQSRRVTDYNGTTKVATVSAAWITQPDDTSGYFIRTNHASTVDEVTDKAGYSLAATGLDLIVSTATGMVEIAKAVWDRVISKSNHNIGQSAGKDLRELGQLIAADGAVSGTPTTTVFTTNITGFDDNFFVDQVISATNGADQAGQGRVISAYNGTTGVFTVDEPFTTALNSGDDVVIFTPHVHPVTQIATAVWDALTAALTTASSIGKLLVDNINATILSRSDFNSATDSVDAGKISGSTLAADNLEASAETMLEGAAVTGTLSTTQMTTDVAESTDDHFNGRIIIWTSGVLLRQATDITDYDGATGMFTFTATTEAPANGDSFIVV